VDNTLTSFDDTTARSNNTSTLVAAGFGLAALGTIIAVNVMNNRTARQLAEAKRDEARLALEAMKQASASFESQIKPKLPKDNDKNFKALDLNMEERMEAAISKMLRRTNFSERAVSLAQATQAEGELSNSEMLDIIVESRLVA